MYMSDIDMDWLLSTMREAGSIALSHFGKTKGTLKSDASWVTQADLDVEAFLRKELALNRPEDSILGEEGDNPEPESAIVWAIDPVDGTRAFNHGFPIWGVSVGVLHDGIPTLGAFILPAIGDMYYTDGETAYYNSTPLEPPEPELNSNAVLLVSEGAYDELRISSTCRLFSLGSAAAHLCYVARGSAVGTFDRASVWDYAASAAILKAVGISIRHLSGSELDFRTLYSGTPVQEPTLACSPCHFEDLQSNAEPVNPPQI